MCYYIEEMMTIPKSDHLLSVNHDAAAENCDITAGHLTVKVLVLSTYLLVKENPRAGNFPSKRVSVCFLLNSCKVLATTFCPL